MITPTRIHALFGGAVRVAHFGTAAGNFSPRQADWLARHRAAADALGLGRQVRLRVNFSNVVAGGLRDSDVQNVNGLDVQNVDGLDVQPLDISPVDDVVFETRAVAEGYRLAGPGVGAAITSADCCTGVLWDGDQAVAMHLGLGCVHRDDETVIQNAVRALPRADVIWLGAAIGPCCYGFPERDDAERARVAAIRARWGDAATPGPVQRGPRRGWAAIDHVAIAAAHAESLGLRVEIDRVCTACQGLADPEAPGYGDFYSNTRDLARGLERNLVVVSIAR